MQLNTQSLNSNTSQLLSKPHLAVYDHKLTVINTEIFVFGKNIQNFSIQTPLHKINLDSLRVEPVFTQNAPSFQDFIMFSLEQKIYLWGKTPYSQINQLFQFDGTKFTKLDQNGPVPSLHGPYSSTIFSHRYVLLFGCLTGNQIQNKWYIFDIKKRTWRQVLLNIQIPISQKSSLIWRNGRGYLLLQSSYDKKSQTFIKNLLFEIKFRSFSKLILELRQINFPFWVQGQKRIFTDIVLFQDRYLVMIGAQQISNSNQNQLMKIDFNNEKILYKFDLELFSWLQEYQSIPIKGSNSQIISEKNGIYFIGGFYQNKVLPEIQYFEIVPEKEDKKFLYQQSLCYYCECAFTYTQRLLYEPAVQKEYEKFSPKIRIENKFIKKLSQSITTQFQAIGILSDFLASQACQEIHINLSQIISSNQKKLRVKHSIQNKTNDVLVVKGFTQNETLSEIIQKEKEDELTKQQFENSSEQELQFLKFKIACFKLGYGFLYVTSNKNGKTSVIYGSYSQTQFPQSNFHSFSEISYYIECDRKTSLRKISSINKRNIVFENVKLHFQRPEDYQNLQSQFQQSVDFLSKNCVSIYVIGVTNLEKCFQIQPIKGKYYENLRIKSLSSKNQSNSLRKYLKHLNIIESNPKLFFQSQRVELINIYQRFEQFERQHKIREISTSEDTAIKKNQNEQTHFSTKEDDIVISWKKSEMINHCQVYEIRRKFEPHTEIDDFNSIYNRIFLYSKKRLLKTFRTKGEKICGVIELLDDIQVQLNNQTILRKSDERKIEKWVEQIENYLIEQRYSNSSEV